MPQKIKNNKGRCCNLFTGELKGIDKKSCIGYYILGGWGQTLKTINNQKKREAGLLLDFGKTALYMPLIS